MYKKIIQELEVLIEVDRAEKHQRYFKTKKGEYAEKDIFICISVPNIRVVVTKFFKEASLLDITKLLHSNIHEYRHCALIMLTHKYKACKTIADKKVIVDLYLDDNNRKYINNWDLVDVSCSLILGHYCFTIKDYSILYTLLKSYNMWDHRIAIISNLYLIKQGIYNICLDMVIKLINHKHNLIHKAMGWMIREIGNQNQAIMLDFLDKNYKVMPRVTLSYATGKLTKEQKSKYYSKHI